MKKGITYGTYDLLHPVQIKLLEIAKKLGDYLVVAVSTNEFNSLKNKKTRFGKSRRTKDDGNKKYFKKDIYIRKNN